jgi:hypothetical protein
MRTHSRRTWPLFLAVAVVGVLGLFVVHGVASGVLLFVALIALMGTCIYGLAGERVQDGCGGIAGGTNY